MRSSDGTRGLFEQELIKTQVQVEHVLAEREHTRQGNEGCTRLPDTTSALTSLFPLQNPHRSARQDEGERRIGLHRRQPRQDTLQEGNVAYPADEHKEANHDCSCTPGL